MILMLPINLMKFPANISQYVWWTPHFVFVYRKRYLAYELSNKVALRNDFDDMSRTAWENKNYSQSDEMVTMSLVAFTFL
jgi:hypothetical protein